MTSLPPGRPCDLPARRVLRPPNGPPCPCLALRAGRCVRSQMARFVSGCGQDRRGSAREVAGRCPPLRRCRFLFVTQVEPEVFHERRLDHLSDRYPSRCGELQRGCPHVIVECCATNPIRRGFASDRRLSRDLRVSRRAVGPEFVVFEPVGVAAVLEPAFLVALDVRPPVLGGLVYRKPVADVSCDSDVEQDVILTFVASVQVVHDGRYLVIGRPRWFLRRLSRPLHARRSRSFSTTERRNTHAPPTFLPRSTSCMTSRWVMALWRPRISAASCRETRSWTRGSGRGSVTHSV